MRCCKFEPRVMQNFTEFGTTGRRIKDRLMFKISEGLLKTGREQGGRVGLGHI